MRFAEYMEAQQIERRARMSAGHRRKPHNGSGVVRVRPPVVQVEVEPEEEPEPGPDRPSAFDVGDEVPQAFKDKVMAELAEADRRIAALMAER